MALEVAVYSIARHKRSQICCAAMVAGIEASGDRVYSLPEESYRGPLCKVAAFYGYTPTLRKIMADYIKRGLKAVYIDLGYWSREGLTGYHKVAVNDRHPTAYFQKVKHSPDRIAALGITAKPWRRRGNHILLAGMGPKAAEVEGKVLEEWELRAIDLIRMATDRPIVYRPKPSWLQAKPLAGTIYSPMTMPLQDSLDDCHAVVTHHSNVAVDGLVEGIPAFCIKGVAMPMASIDLTKIETPHRPDGREQWLADIAYTQWSIAEIAEGKPWQHLKNEGLI